MEYVSEQADAGARSIEKKFQELPAEAGVLFVAVTPVPAESGKVDTFDVFIGISRTFSIEYGIALVEKVLAPELHIQALKFRAKVHRGVIGTCRDEPAAPARQAQA